MKYHKIFVALLLPFLISSCKKQAVVAPLPGYKSLGQLISTTPQLSTFNYALQKAGLSKQLLADTGLYTIFAPDNAAFQTAGITTDVIDHMGAATLKDLLAYHIARGNFPSQRIMQNNNYQLIMSDSLQTQVAYALGDYNTATQQFDPKTTGITINAAHTVTYDIEGNNGILDIIDKVNNPPTKSLMELINADPDLSYYAAALNAVGDVSFLTDPGFKPLTLFLPNNKAFNLAGYTSINQINQIAARGDASTDTLTNIVQSSIIPSYGYFIYQAIQNSSYGGLSAFNGASIQVLSTQGVATIILLRIGKPTSSKANFVTTDNYASDGVLNKIDHILNIYAP